MRHYQRSHVADFTFIATFPLQVKADKDSSNLQRLQQASRGVTQATAAVVASTKSGKSQIEETGEFAAVTEWRELIFDWICLEDSNVASVMVYKS